MLKAALAGLLEELAMKSSQSASFITFYQPEEPESLDED